MLVSDLLESTPTMTQNCFLLCGQLLPVFLSYIEMFWKRQPSDFLLFLLVLVGETGENVIGMALTGKRIVLQLLFVFAFRIPFPLESGSLQNVVSTKK